MATASTGVATAAHTSQAPVEAKSRPPSVPGQEEEGGEADGEHAGPGEVGPAEPAARPPGPGGQGEEDAAGEHRLHHQQLAHAEGEGLEPVAHGVGAQPREPDRAAGEAQHEADPASDRAALVGSGPVGTGVGLRFALLQHRRGGVGERRPQRQQHGRHAPRTVVSAFVRRSILIVSASMGAGHDGAAKELRRRLEASGHRVEVVDFLDAVAFHIGPLLRWFYQVQLRMAPWSYELSYKMAPLLRAPAVMLDTWLTRRKLKQLIKEFRPDAVVSVYPLASLVLGRMRRKKQLRVPVLTYLTDFAVHSLWVHRGIDRHLAVSEISAEAATSRGGNDARARGPLVSDALPRRDVRPRRGPHQPRSRARGPRGAGGRGLVGRGRRRRHRRGDRPQRRLPPDHRVRA